MHTQANFRFMVLKSSATPAHARDADVASDWEDVVQVEMLVEHEQALQCPICLDAPPSCPQVCTCRILVENQANQPFVGERVIRAASHTITTSEPSSAVGPMQSSRRRSSSDMRADMRADARTLGVVERGG